MPAFKAKRKYEKLAAVIQVLQYTQTSVASRCFFADDGKEMYEDL